MMQSDDQQEFLYEYNYVKPGLFRTAYRVSLTNESIICQASRNGVDYKPISRIDYDAIESINLIRPSKEKEILQVNSVTGKMIEVQSRSDGKCEDGRLVPMDIDQRDGYDDWVVVLHQLLISRGQDRSIKFVVGSSSRRVLVLLLCIGAGCGLLMALYQNRPGLIALTGGVLLILISYYISLGNPVPYSAAEKAVEKPHRFCKPMRFSKIAPAFQKHKT